MLSIFSPLGDLVSLVIDVDIFSCFYYHRLSGISVCKPGSACLEKMGKEIDNNIKLYDF